MNVKVKLLLIVFFFPCPFSFFCLFRYHIPRSFLRPTGNLLVLFDEEYGNPLGISIDIASVTKVCHHMSESSPAPILSWKGDNQSSQKHKKGNGRTPRVELRCPSNKYISRILFSSFGTPVGDCNSYSVGSCHSSHSKAIVEKVNFT